MKITTKSMKSTETKESFTFTLNFILHLPNSGNDVKMQKVVQKDL